MSVERKPVALRRVGLYYHEDGSNEPVVFEKDALKAMDIRQIERVEKAKKWRETFRLAVPGSDEEYAAYLDGFDAAFSLLTTGEMESKADGDDSPLREMLLRDASDVDRADPGRVTSSQECFQGDRSRPYTPDEVRDMLLESLMTIAKYWADLPDVDQATGHRKSVQDRCEGVVFSMLTLLDGCTMVLPAFDLIVRPHSDDKSYAQSEGENWFEPNTVISDMLHEHLHRFTKPRKTP